MTELDHYYDEEGYLHSNHLIYKGGQSFEVHVRQLYNPDLAIIQRYIATTEDEDGNEYEGEGETTSEAISDLMSQIEIEDDDSNDDSDNDDENDDDKDDEDDED